MSKEPEKKHAVYAPSSMKIIMECEAAPVLWADLPDGPTSEYAAEGTLAHSYVERMLKSQTQKERTAILKEITDEEMKKHVQDFYTFIQKMRENFLSKSKGKWFEFIEQKVELSENCFGTLDYGLVAVRNGVPEAIICDFKYGKGVDVDAEDNAQLTTYAAALNKHFKNALKKFYIFIYQPRTPGEPYKRWEPVEGAVEQWGTKVLKRIQVIEGLKEKYPTLDLPDLHYSVGDHCRFCKAKMSCKMIAEDVKSKALAVFQAAEESKPLPAVNTVPLDTLLHIFKSKKIIESYLADVEHHLLTLKMNGGEVPGYKLVHGRSVRKWLDDTDTVAKALKARGVKQPLKKSLITIGEVETALGEGKIADLTTKTEPKLQLAPVDDKRKEVITSDKALELLTVLSPESSTPA